MTPGFVTLVSLALNVAKRSAAEKPCQDLVALVDLAWKPCHTAKRKYRNFETNNPRKECRGLSPNFHIHASVSDLYIPTIVLPILLEEI